MRISECDPNLWVARFRRGIGFEPLEFRFREAIQEGYYVGKVVVANSGVDDRSIEEDGIQEFFADLAVGSYEAGLDDEIVLFHGD